MRMRVLLILFMAVGLCGAALGAEAGVAEEELSPFSGSLADAAWTVVSFFALLLVLWRLAWKPVLVGLTARQEFIEKQLKDAEGTHEEARQVLSEYQDKLANAEREGKGIIDVRRKEGEKEAGRIIDEAGKEADALRVRLQMDLERARKQAEAELLDEAGGIVLKLGEEILGRTLQDEDHEKMINQAIERLKESGESTAGQ
ncbi:MAG: F0F1 ATP synthase subunit B [Planctomycetes bacterium]|nr:F0F1 ATP synthase subunit B [Planctomycetota bacterium]